MLVTIGLKEGTLELESACFISKQETWKFHENQVFNMGQGT